MRNFVAMKTLEDKGARALAFYDCVFPRTRNHRAQMEQKIEECAHEQNETTGNY